MVFARAKLVLEDNCFAEEPGRVYMRLHGPGLEKLYEKVYETMKSVFNVTDADIQETNYSWAKGGERGDKFAMTWWIHKDFDVFSYLYVNVKMKGVSGPNGHADLQIRGLLRSEYPQDSVWQRSLPYEVLRTFWHRIFYHKKREEYAEECRHNVIMLERRIKEFYNKISTKA